MLFCFFKLFVAVGKGLKFAVKFSKGCYALSCYVYPVRAWAAGGRVMYSVPWSI